MNQPIWRRWIEIWLVSTKLGFTSFGGPIAHLGYFQHEYVQKRKWLDQKSYADLIALCQFLPGPASSQVGISIGMLRGGVIGGVISWFGFTMPSVLLLMIAAIFLTGHNVQQEGIISGLKIVAVAVVAQAVLGMGKTLTPDRPRLAIAIGSSVVLLVWPYTFVQIGTILLAALFGIFMYRQESVEEEVELPFSKSKAGAIISLSLFFVLLAVLPLLSWKSSSIWFEMMDTFYRAGAIVFGGGHVVLPILQQEVVPYLLSKEHFLAGYGAAQAVPGPLFTFSSYLGTVVKGWSGGLLATFAMFLPSFLLVMGVLPFWNELRRNKRVRAALLGVNASVVGILLASLYDPVFVSAVSNAHDFALALICFGLLVYGKVPAFVVVMLGVAGSFILTYM
ncbi:chromate efflux transporter [Priestia koreensis]|uniref:chromate efflux transporter n=1 Tax=Priestia koreensis TaxID=284581 RepID=UPI003017D8F4